MFKSILVPVDDSDLTHRSVEVALSLADRFGSEVVLLTIRRKAASLEHGEAEADLDAIDHQTKQLVAQGLTKLRNDHTVRTNQIRGEVRAGPVVQIIAEAAEELMVDCIVMGTHGRKGVSEMFTGSTTERVVAKTSASVLVVKPEGFPFLRD